MCTYQKSNSTYQYASTCIDSFTILGLWFLGLAVSHMNESQLQTYEFRTLFLMTSLQYCCILGLVEIKNVASQRQNYAQKMQDAQVKNHCTCNFTVYHLVCFVSIWVIHKKQLGIDISILACRQSYTSFINKISEHSQVFPRIINEVKLAVFSSDKCQQDD